MKIRWLSKYVMSINLSSQNMRFQYELFDSNKHSFHPYQTAPILFHTQCTPKICITVSAPFDANQWAGCPEGAPSAEAHFYDKDVENEHVTWPNQLLLVYKFVCAFSDHVTLPSWWDTFFGLARQFISTYSPEYICQDIPVDLEIGLHLSRTISDTLCLMCYIYM